MDHDSATKVVKERVPDDWTFFFSCPGPVSLDPGCCADEGGENEWVITLKASE